MKPDDEGLGPRHEESFVTSFIISERRERYRFKLSSRDRRNFLNRLNHAFRSDLDPRFIVEGKREWPEQLQNCYVIADERQFDGRIVSASDAFDLVNSASFGIVISFLPGKLACYKDEEPSEILWLERI